ncbi:TPM domain-containing protein [Enterococcus sp. CSURQ0835]|uniref:TPM domain-containing protein n=1 Tax=Enterococcus sp. CSURQ0835 TaxID=2681394 RepID=UPI00135C5E07|nr:TPM domain-containing protein [Enterococcus sp. CSURQ0835]
MIKKIVLPLLFLCVFLFPLKVWAASDTIDDPVDLFSADQKIRLSEQADPLNQKIKGQVFIVTTENNSDEPRDFANNYLRQKVGNDHNGAVLLLDMGQRQIYIATSGNMIDYLDDDRINHILDTVTEKMKSGDYAGAGEAYLTQAAQYVADGVPGGHYRVDEKTGKITRYKALTPFELAIALVVALVSASAFYLITKARYQLKSGTYRYPYRQNAKLELSSRDDHLINSFVTTRIIPKARNNDGGGFGGGGSTTNSSGGGTFGGGGRGF